MLDPVQDALGLVLTPDSDLTGICAEISKENNLHIFIETKGDIEEHTKYSLNMVFIYGNISKRITVEYLNNKVYLINLTNHEPIASKKIKFQVKGNILHIILPKSFTGEYNHLYLNATTSILDHMLDKTAWRMSSK